MNAALRPTLRRYPQGGGGPPRDYLASFTNPLGCATLDLLRSPRGKVAVPISQAAGYWISTLSSFQIGERFGVLLRPIQVSLGKTGTKIRILQILAYHALRIKVGTVQSNG